MQDSAKYLIHAEIRASGVVERSDVVGAIFGQTEGLLGTELDLRTLQDASKVGRIDVQIDSEAGRSYGTVTIATALDKAETAVLAAALETIDRVGPCRAEFEVTDLEDARAAKRREVIDRAIDLLADFEEATLSSDELVEEVRRNIRVEEISEYEGLPAGPRVTDSDAIIVVEGRADVLTLLSYGIKNAIAVEGTDIPDAVAELTRSRTVTTFLDGDRGGDLILKELDQVGSVDYVTFAPAGTSVEDLSREQVLSALRKKAPYDQVSGSESIRDAFTGERQPTDSADEPAENAEADAADPPPSDNGVGESTAATVEASVASGEAASDSEPSSDGTTAGNGENEEAADSGDESPSTLAGHVDAVAGSGLVRLLGEDCAVLTDVPTEDAFEAIEDAAAVPETVVFDGDLSQRILDVAAQRGVREIVATGTGEFVKQPTGVRVRLAADV